MTTDVRDYLFDLHGYLRIEQAVAPDDIDEMNRWADAHREYIDRPWEDGVEANRRGRWIGAVHTHTYNVENGVNFQNIIAAGPVFEKLIDHPSWIDLAKRYIGSAVNDLSIHENFMTVRGQGGFIHIHCGGHVPLSYLTFRQNNTGDWMVGQINVLIALTDIGPGDGPTVLVPGSHKSAEPHPRLEQDGKGLVYDGVTGEAAGTAFGVQEMYLEKGDALFFTDAITHGSAERTNPGERRTVIFRYSPRYVRERFNYRQTPEFLAGLTHERRQIVQPIAPQEPDARPDL